MTIKVKMKNWEEVRKIVYFPLCYSEEQKQVIDMLFQNNGVVIDGVCGTGKSQTLVNLICNLMAHGKNVVVTAKNESQLKILFNRIPEPIRGYCDLNVKYNSKKIKKKNILSKSVACEVYKSICNLKEELNSCTIKQREIKNKLEKIKELRRTRIQYEGVKYSIDYIEYWVKKNEFNYLWFIDDIDLKEKCPLSDEEFSELIYILSKVDKRHIQQLRLKGNIIDIIPNYSVVYKKIQEIRTSNVNKEAEAFIENVKNLLIASEFYSIYNALENYLIEHCSKNLYQFVCEYNNVEIFKRERVYYKESMKYTNILKNICPLLVDKILSSDNYDVFKGKKISQAWKWKKWSKLIKIINMIDYNCYESQLNEEKMKEIAICKEIIIKQLQYNQYINYKVNKKNFTPVTMVSLNKFKRKSGQSLVDTDVVIIEDGNNVDSSNLDILNKFSKIIITQNSKLYEEDIETQISIKENISKLKFDYDYRFNPHLYSSISVKVNKGMKNKEKNINVVEADEIVKYITMCVQDERYNNMSFGVISLYNNEQALVIQDKLIKKLGKKVIKDRKLICGDINSFVGDERDIIFMSMVVADNEKFYSVRKKADRIKYSIAATRARCEMWIFYSFDKYSINKECMRYKLLKNCNDDYGHKLI